MILDHYFLHCMSLYILSLFSMQFILVKQTKGNSFFLDWVLYAHKMGRFAYSTTVKWWSSSSVFRLLVFHIIILYVSYIFLLKETLALQTETVHTYIQTEDRQGSPDVDKQSSTSTREGRSQGSSPPPTCALAMLSPCSRHALAMLVSTVKNY